MNEQLFKEIVTRMNAVTHTRTQTELATWLEIKQSSISDAKRRKSIPSKWYLTLFEKMGVNPDWLKKGTGPIYVRAEAGCLPKPDNPSSAPQKTGTGYQ